MPTKTTNTTKQRKETAPKTAAAPKESTASKQAATAATPNRSRTRAIDALNAPKKLARKKDELATIAPDAAPASTAKSRRRPAAAPAPETPAAPPEPAPAQSRRSSARQTPAAPAQSGPAPTPVVRSKPVVVAPPEPIALPVAQREATWYRMDLHMHTPASHDYEQPEKSYLDILKQAEKRGLHMIAFTDHNSASGFRNMLREISDLEMLERLDRIRPDELARLEEFRRLLKKIVVLPGFEFTATFGFHILGIFPPDKPLREIENVLVQLRVPSMAIDLGLTEAGATSDVLTAYRLIDEAGGIAIAAHANSSNGVSMRGMNLGGQTRISFTQDPHLHAIEFTDLDRGRRSSAMLFRGTRAEYPRIMHVVQGSDAHRIAIDPKNPKRLGIGERPTEVELPNLSFGALRELFASQEFDRIRPVGMIEAKETTDGLQAARIAGESATVVFHATLPKRPEKKATRGKARQAETNPAEMDEAYDAILRDICAMANGTGGHVYIGCEANLRKKPAGVSDPAAATQLSEAIYRQIHPAINSAVSTQPIDGDSDGKHVIAVRVSASDKAPFNYKNSFWVRDGVTTRVGTRDEIVAIVRRVVEEGLAASAAARVTAPAQNQQAQQPRRSAHQRSDRTGDRTERTGDRPNDRGDRSSDRTSDRSGDRDTNRVERNVEQPRPERVAPQQRPHADRNEQVRNDQGRNEPGRNEPGRNERVNDRGQSNRQGQPNPPAQRERNNQNPAQQQQVQPQTPQQPQRVVEQTPPPVVTPPATPTPVEAAPPTASTAPAAPPARRSFMEELQAAQAKLAANAVATPKPAQPSQQPTQSSASTERGQSQPANGGNVRIEGAPRNGVQVLGMEERDGVVYFTVRDVRNNTLVRNVTLKSARDLWHYAITQHADNPDGPEDLGWQGNKAVVSKALRAGKMRYDLAVRDAEGNVRMFYGVTDDGLSEGWRELVTQFNDANASEDEAEDDEDDEDFEAEDQQ